MSNQRFIVLALLLLILNIAAAMWIQPFSDPTLRANALSLNAALEEELNSLRTAIATGCESPIIKDAVLFIDVHNGGNTSTVMPSASADLAVHPTNHQNEGTSMKPAELAAMLDTAVVSVIGTNTAASGFFITPSLLVTSARVIQGNAADPVYVTSPAMKQVMKAELVSKSAAGSGKQTDLALLRLPADFAAPAVLRAAGPAIATETVIAAGIAEHAYDPGKKRAAVISGNAAEAAATQLSPGKIKAIQSQKNGIKRILHTAELGPAHAGGPLADRCGRVVGVNRIEEAKNQQDSRALNAISAEDLVAFLRANGIDYKIAPTACAAGL